MHICPMLKEHLIVREWLQEIASPPIPPEASNGCWKFTKHTIMQNVRIGHAPREGPVSEMDSDMVNRSEGVTLAADDAVCASMLRL